MDGDYTLADLDHLGFSECKFDEEQWICNIDTALLDLYVEDYYQTQVTITMDGDYTLLDLEHLGFSECKFDEDQ